MINSLSTAEFEGYIKSQRGRFASNSELKIIVKRDPKLNKFIMWAVPYIAYRTLSGERMSQHYWKEAIGLASLEFHHTGEESASFDELKHAFRLVADREWSK